MVLIVLIGVISFIVLNNNESEFISDFHPYFINGKVIETKGDNEILLEITSGDYIKAGDKIVVKYETCTLSTLCQDKEMEEEDYDIKLNDEVGFIHFKKEIPQVEGCYYIEVDKVSKVIINE